MLYALLLFTKAKDPVNPHFSRPVSCCFLERLSLLLLPRPSGFMVLEGIPEEFLEGINEELHGSLEGIHEEKARRITGIAAGPSMRVQRVKDWTSIQLGWM